MGDIYDWGKKREGARQHYSSVLFQLKSALELGRLCSILGEMKIVKADQGHSQRKYTRHRKRSAFSLIRGYKVLEAAKELDLPKLTAHYRSKKEEDVAQKRIEQAEEESWTTKKNSQ